MKWSYKLPTKSGSYYVCELEEGTSVRSVQVRDDGSVSWFVGDGPMGDGVSIIDKPNRNVQFMKVEKKPKVVWGKNEPPDFNRVCETCSSGKTNGWCDCCMWGNKKENKAGNKWYPTSAEEERYNEALSAWEKVAS